MIGWLVLAAYVIGFFVTWVIGTGMYYRNEIQGDKYTGPIEGVLMSGTIGFVIAMCWPIAAMCLVIFRIATKEVSK